MEDEHLLRREQRRRPKRTKETQEKLSEFAKSRRHLLKLLGLGTAGIAAVGLGIWRPWESRPQEMFLSHPDLKGAKPLPHVERALVQKIVNFEAGYTREDLLGDSATLLHHLELAVEFFARYSGTPLTKEKLVESVHWLPLQEFEARFGEGVVGHAEHTTGDIFISSESPSFRSTFNAQPKDVLPYWSTLSRARTVYWHEFFHKAAFGSNRKPEQGLEMIVKADNKDYHLEAIHGFTLEYVNKESGQSKFSGSFDEGFVTYLVSTVERQMSGFVVYESSPEGETGTPGIKIDRVVNRLEALFKKRRSWEKVFQKFHMESDFFGLARFLASQSGLSFDTNFKRDAYGLGIILSMSDDNAPNFDDFITRLK